MVVTGMREDEVMGIHLQLLPLPAAGRCRRRAVAAAGGAAHPCCGKGSGRGELRSKHVLAIPDDMLVLFETAVGFAVFKLSDEKKLKKADELFEHFDTPAKAGKLISLQHFEKYKDATEALTSVTSLIEGKISKKLKKALKKIVSHEEKQVMAVADSKLGTSIRDKFNLECTATDAVQKLMTCIRSQLPALLPQWNADEESAMQLAVSHGLGRYKLKFSPDKVDTMIIQAISLLDDVDKELNNYVMRCKEWYGWHFPELVKIVPDASALIKVIMKMGMKQNAATTDLSDILPEEVEEKVKEIAEISMGSEISDEDLLNIQALGSNVLDLQEYRQHLFEYLKKRMMAIAPNLTILVGEIVGARLISKAGSLIGLAKYPASTVQILGAEKALFRALKARHDTPKYGLIYHAQLVGQSNPRLKGKMSRMLAAKASLATRVDALGEEVTDELGIEHRAKLEAKLKFLEEGGMRRISGTGKGKAETEKFHHKSVVLPYKPATDSTIPIASSSAAASGEATGEPPAKKAKKNKKKKQKAQPQAEPEPEATTSADDAAEEKKKKKKEKKDKKRKLIEEIKSEEAEEEEAVEEPAEEPDDAPSKKKKKKKKL